MMCMPVSVWPCGCRTTAKATDAAIKARQWTKAVQIVDLQEAGEVATQHFQQLAEHFASAKHFEVSSVGVAAHAPSAITAWPAPPPACRGVLLKGGTASGSREHVLCSRTVGGSLQSEWEEGEGWDGVWQGLTAGLALPQLAVGCMEGEELQQRYYARGAELEKDGKLRDAERCVSQHAS